MGATPTVGEYHFDGWELPTKYGWMHTGAGVQAATLTQDAVREMSERLIASGGLVRDLLGGAEWAGAAAIAAGEAMRRGADQITQTAAGAATADRCVTELGESFVTAQHRVPAPNEVPTGLGDQFLYGAAEGVSALSPFDVQSPLHAAMQQRRELDQQANLALTDHMVASRERVEAMPAVAAPAPMTVTAQSAGPSGIGVGQPTGVIPTVPGSGDGPAVTHPAGVGGGSSAVPVAHAGPGSGGGGAAVPSGPHPEGTGPASAPPVGGGSRPGTSGPGGPVTGPGPAGTVTAPPTVGSAGRATGGAGAAGSGSGIRAGVGGEGGSRRGASGAGGGASGTGGPAAGSALPARGAGFNAAPGRTAGGAAAGRAGGSSFLQPPIGGRGSGDDDREHKNRYAQQADHIVGELPLVAPAVLGETPDEEARRLRDGG